MQRLNYRMFLDVAALSTSELPDLDLFERIDAELREILADHRPEPLSESIRSEIDSIQRSFAESYREIAI